MQIKLKKKEKAKSITRKEFLTRELGKVTKDNEAGDGSTKARLEVMFLLSDI